MYHFVRSSVKSFFMDIQQLKKKKKETGTVPPQEGTNMFIHDYS